MLPSGRIIEEKSELRKRHTAPKALFQTRERLTPFRDNEKAIVTILLGYPTRLRQSPMEVLFGEKVGRVQALMLENGLLELA